MVERAVAEYGRIDVLANVAGTNRRKPVLEVSEEDYEVILATNLKSAYFASQAVAPVMMRQGRGSIINIASLTSLLGINLNTVYSASKGGVAQITRSMAVEWAEHGIRVNAIAPGFIKTEMAAGIFNDPRKVAWVIERTPMRRPGLPEDVMGAAVFLASDASAFMTGQILFVDGGFSAGDPWPA